MIMTPSSLLGYCLSLLLVQATMMVLVFGSPPLHPLYDFSTILAQKVKAVGPTQVHISYPGLDQMLVVWVSPLSPNSSSGSDASSTVAYGTSSTNLNLVATGNVTSYTFQGYKSGSIHTVLLKGLSSSTQYYYKVGDGTLWSNVFSFTSAPPVGKEDITFGAIGDVGADPNSELTIQGLLGVNQREGLDLIVHAGDLSYANNYNPGGPVWDHYGDIFQPLISQIPYNPSVGNHETIDLFTGFRLRYATTPLQTNSQGGDFYWSVNYGNIHFVHLSSENPYSPSSPQYTWLLKDLASVDRSLTPWIIALWHRPWYNSNNAHFNEGEAMRKSIEPLFVRYKVDLALLGHVHAYERVAPVVDGKLTPGGTAYVTIGNGGTPEGLATDWRTQPVWSQFRVAKWGYTRVRVYNGTHAHLTMWGDGDGTVLDDHWFVRGA